MEEPNDVFWGIHGGKTGDADKLFRSDKRIALGWTEMPDLRTLEQSREAYKQTLASANPKYKPRAIPGAAGQMFRFVNEMRIGDRVIYRSKATAKCHLGVVTSDYLYDPKANEAYPHQRSVKWIKEVLPTEMSQGALYEIGSAMSFFQVRNYAEEWAAAITGETVIAGQETAPTEDDSIAMVAESINQNTRDFVLKQFQSELKGHPFAEFVGHLLSKMGYVTRVSPPGADGGVDIIAHRDQLGFEPPIIKVQVKSSDGNIGNQDVAYLSGTLAPTGEFGLMVSLSDFTNQAKSFAKGKSNLRLLNAEEVIDLTLRYYDLLDPKYKAIIPLKQVFVPEPPDD